MQDMERISSFIKSFISDDEGLLGDIYSEAIKNRVPVMRKETRELLKTQIIMKKPMQNGNPKNLTRMTKNIGQKL